jgi:hypothetical protein
LIFWLLFGWLADYSFPFGQALELMLACFKGTVSSKINTLQKQLQKADVIVSGRNIRHWFHWMRRHQVSDIAILQ